MRKLPLALLLLCTLAELKASHIVGGEFELLHLQNYFYQLNLVQYFDKVNGKPEREEQEVQAYIFSKKDEVLVRKVTLSKVHTERVRYSNAACTQAELVTQKIIYSARLEMPPGVFADAEGYFVVFESCCRNKIISNLETPEQTGQTFYMEFPAVSRKGVPFVNSSPVLSPPVSDYACIHQPFRYDFRSTDPDGDSLVYSLVVPYNSSTNEDIPTPAGAPQKEVVFSAGIGVENMVPGMPSLYISNEGVLTVKPDAVGVYIFGVKVEEYRDKVKIGEIRRDFQLPVQDCHAGHAPQLWGQVAGSDAVYRESGTIFFKGGDTACVSIGVTDRDAAELITLKAEGVNFDQDIQYLLPEEASPLNGAGDTLRIDFCLPLCPLTQEPMVIDIIAMDNACSQPLTDTLRLTVSYEPPPNEDPFIAGNPHVLQLSLKAGEVYELPLQGIDHDKDPLRMEMRGLDFTPEAFGMSLEEVYSEAGSIEKVFRWDPRCDKHDFSSRQSFDVVISLSDSSHCTTGKADELLLRLKVETPVSNRPRVFLADGMGVEISVPMGESLEFEVFAEEKDGDSTTLYAVGDGFALQDYQMRFAESSGKRKLSSIFSWLPHCEVPGLPGKSRFEVFFIAKDRNMCSGAKTDTLRVSIQVLPPRNTPPEIILAGSSDTVQTVRGLPLLFEVKAVDAEGDLLTLELSKISRNGVEVAASDLAMTFESVQGYQKVSSFFSWVPDCGTLSGTNGPAFFEAAFVARDHSCAYSESDTLRVVIRVSDVPLSLELYLPANAFTPNQDGAGDYFSLPDLPEGNCNNRFQKIDIYSRWGNLVYSSDRINFRWYAEGVPPGLYYYTVYYNRQVYRNQVYVYVPGR